MILAQRRGKKPPPTKDGKTKTSPQPFRVNLQDEPSPLGEGDDGKKDFTSLFRELNCMDVWVWLLSFV